MKILWCWRCQQEISMLEATEVALLKASKSKTNGMAAVEAEARRRGQKLGPALELDRINEYQRPLLEMYCLLTGFEETNVNAVYHHLVDLYGPPCPQCHKPLRTPEARFCAACGFGQEDVTADSLPLPQRRPELFTA